MSVECCTLHSFWTAYLPETLTRHETLRKLETLRGGGGGGGRAGPGGGGGLPGGGKY